MYKLYFYILFFIYLIFNIKSTYSLDCKDGDGKSVDWYMVYKLPLIEESKVDNVKNGVGQVYMDNVKPIWTYLDNPIDSKSHAIYNTLQQIYNKQNSSKIMSLMYNDEEPVDSSKTTSGHTKGVLASDDSQGFWLIHSVPKFPPSQSYNYPKTGKIFGQTLLCITINYSQVNSIGQQLRFYRPNIYDKVFPESFSTNNSNIVKLLAGNFLGLTVPWSNIVNIQSSAGIDFTSFAKSAKFNDDLYSGLVASKLGSHIEVESWRNGPARDLPSNCSIKYHVQNIKTILLLNFSFDTTKDHSKWAISMDNKYRKNNKNWVCIGDINRQESQFKRGGGTICLNDAKPWKQFSDATITIEPCPRKILENDTL